MQPRKSSGKRVAFTEFTPADLEGAGLYAWYDASDLSDTTKASVSGTDVNQWYNQSSNGSSLDFTLTSANKPQVTSSHKIGGLDGIEFDNVNAQHTNMRMGNGESYLGPASTLLQDFYIFFIIKTIFRTPQATGSTASSGFRHSGSGNALKANSYFNSHTPWTSGHWFMDITNNQTDYRINTSAIINDGDIWMGGFENSHTNNRQRMRVNGSIEATSVTPVSSYRGVGFTSTGTWAPAMVGTFIQVGTYNSQPAYTMYDGNGSGNNWYLWWDNTAWNITDNGYGPTGTTYFAIGGTNVSDPTDNGGNNWSSMSGFTSTGGLASHDSSLVFAQIGVNSYYTFGELITISGSALSDVNIEKIEGYLAHKWGQTSSLPSNHPYKNNRPLK